MAETKKWTQEDTVKQNRLISDAKTELLKIAREFDSAWLEAENISPATWKDKEQVRKKYETTRNLHQIEALQQILVYHGAEQPMTSLPFLAHHAVEYVKKHGTVGPHRSQ